MKVTWCAPNDFPNCPEGQMIPVILQRNGKVFGGWYCNKYPLDDEYDSFDEPGLATGFCEKVPHGEFDDYYEFAALHELQCWAHMPIPRR